jgi:hypothetical protein
LCKYLKTGKEIFQRSAQTEVPVWPIDDDVVLATVTRTMILNVQNLLLNQRLSSKNDGWPIDNDVVLATVTRKIYY